MNSLWHSRKADNYLGWPEEILLPFCADVHIQFHSNYLPKFLLLLSVFHWPFSWQNAMHSFSKLFLTGSAALNPMALCYCQYAFVNLRLPNQGIMEVEKQWKSKCQPLLLGISKATESAYAYQTLRSKFWQILDGTTRVIQDWDAERCRDKDRL